MKHFYPFLILLISFAMPAWGQQKDNHVYTITHLGRNVNTPGAEASGLLINDSTFLYSSLQGFDGQNNGLINFENEVIQMYESTVSKNGYLEWGKPSKIGFNVSTHHCGNVTYDNKGNTFYFTRCAGEENVQCGIYICQQKKGKWRKPKKLKGDVNLKDCTNTQPAIGYTKAGETVLYFVSNRPGGLGGDDIWYVILEDGKVKSECFNLGPTINTPYDEITPFYDNTTQTLYYSSDRMGGLGGMDIYYAEGDQQTWHTSKAMPSPINSTNNDLYYTVNFNNPDEGFLTSNREDAYFQTEVSCCNDIYQWKRELPPPTLKVTPATNNAVASLPEVNLMPATQKSQGLSYQARALMPIKLYFHNDEPNPKSKATVTTETYFQTYNKYMFMRHTYLQESDAISDPVLRDNERLLIHDFFDNEVHLNCNKFEQFLDILTEDIKMGSHVSLTISGYASAPHSQQYNFNLSKRRISSIINQIMTYKDGILKHYISSNRHGSLQIKEVPYGSEKAESAPNETLYSILAAQDRRIEIIDYNYLDSDPYANSVLTMPQGTQNIGSLPQGETSDIAIRFQHTATETNHIDFISVGIPEVMVTSYSELEPGKEFIVYLHINNRKVNRDDSILIPLTIRVAGEDITQTIFLEYHTTLSDK